MNVIAANKHKANLKVKKAVAKSITIDSRDLVAGALALGAIWAVTQ